MHEKITYNPLQLETIKFKDEDTNVIVLAPTSSGKTIVAEQFMIPQLEKGKRAIYLSPLKALTQEKLEDWSNWKWPLVAITGDHMGVMRPITEKLILMTTEAMDSKSRTKRPFLQEAGIVVCDEAHLLSVIGRGDAFEVGLTRFALQNPNARIVFLSATMPNVKELGAWLTSLNGKETKIVETDWRPVLQEHHLIKIRCDNPWDFPPLAMSYVRKIATKYQDSQLITFVHSIANGEKIAGTFNWPFHYSKIEKEKRHELEDNYRSKKVQRMVSTSTLAWGVNLPCDVGIIFGGHRGPTLVDAQDIKQMAGRVGRYGLSEKGTIFYLFMEDYADQLWQELTDIPEIHSRLRDRLYFHVVSFIARENMQREEVKEFISRTLGGRQYNINADQAINHLIQFDCLKQADHDVLLATNLGKAASLMYVDPIDLWHMRKNLSEKPMSPTLIAQALVEIPSMETHTFVPKNLDRPIEYAYGMQTVYATYLRDWLDGKDIGVAGHVIVQPFVKDFERMVSALRMAGAEKEYIDSVYLLLKYGIGHHLIELVGIDGIGRKKAIDLFKAGIKTKDDYRKKEQLARNIVGASTHAKAMFSLSEHKKGVIMVP